MIFVCVMDYGPDRERIESVRPSHRKYQYGLLDSGKLVAGGSFSPDGDGGLFLYEAATLKDAQSLVQDDPYIREGLIESFKLREYEVHGANRDLLRVTGSPRSTPAVGPDTARS